MTVTFPKTEDGVKLMASYVAQLVKECVGFEIDGERGDVFCVTLTGGF